MMYVYKNAKKRRPPTLLVCRLGPSTALQVTCRVTAYAGILHVLRESVP